ncbi:MAG: orotidine-5'-phosphate decarboxylase [Gammaproteobacteria bacterium]|nr:orotidine-5'-phosphate decarboxylase [Gammaproteobacteria bacterium]
MQSFHERLRRSWQQSGSLLCVGIDPDLDRIPQHLAAADKPYLQFGKAIIEATAPYVCAFKPQAAHFAAVGREQELAELITFAQTNYPDIPVILDAKRGDVGGTAKLYALEAFERYNADAVTVSPYLGKDSLDPYFAFAERGIVVLCRTSNPGSDWLQNSPDNEPPTYLRVAKQISEWDVADQCMLVMGATYPDELAKVRAVVGNLPLLVPGVGAQGGSIEEVLRCGLDAHGTGLVISSSRSIIFADQGPNYADAAAAAAEVAMNEINKFR